MIEYENLKKLNEKFLQAYRDQFNKILESGRFIMGDELTAFEKEFSQYCNTDHCIGVGNGYDALTIALRSLNFAPGDEVIVPSNTYVATILAVLNCGLKPVLVEPDIR